jgi:hypothetical protein
VEHVLSYLKMGCYDAVFSVLAYFTDGDFGRQSQVCFEWCFEWNVSLYSFLYRRKEHAHGLILPIRVKARLWPNSYLEVLASRLGTLDKSN